MVAAACGRDLYFWDIGSDELPKKVLETTIGFLCLYFHPNGNWLLTCEVRSLGTGSSGGAGAALSHTPHFCIRLRDLSNELRPFSSLDPQQPYTDLLPMVLVYSESGTCISPCGSFLAVCLPPLAGEEQEERHVLSAHDIATGGQQPDPSHRNAAHAMDVDGEGAETLFPVAYKHGYIAIISLSRKSFAKVLCTAPIPKAAKITCIRFSASCRYLLVGYGGRDMRPVTSGRLRRGLELYRFVQQGAKTATAHSLHLVRDLTMSNDVLNAAEWQPALGGTILYGTDTGRTVSLTFMRGVERVLDEPSRSPNISDETTRLWSGAAPTQATGPPQSSHSETRPAPIAPQPVQPRPPAGVWASHHR